MIPRSLDRFRTIWAVDFEFSAPPGERPHVVCLVAWELRSGRRIRLCMDGIATMSSPPYDIGPQSLFIAYAAAAEMSCHLALAWGMPLWILDLYAEFRVLTNGRMLPTGALQPGSLVAALTRYGLDAIDVEEKKEMRELAIYIGNGGAYTSRDRNNLLRYCESDVEALARLLPRMLPEIHIGQAMLRGRYVRAMSAMEHRGIPLDKPLFQKLTANLDAIKSQLIREVNRDFDVYDANGSFRMSKFKAYLNRHNMTWLAVDEDREGSPLSTTDDTFKEMAKTYPQVRQLGDLEYILGKLRLKDIAIGEDGRNRCSLKPFMSKTSRNQPSNSQFIFGPAVWERGFVKPPPGMAIAYLNWSAAEVGIAARLSGDDVMLADYLEDPYLKLAIAVGAAPLGAAKRTHAAVRDAFKPIVLGILYGMGRRTLGIRMGKTASHADAVLRAHRERYRRFWQWSAAVVNNAMLGGKLVAAFGWAWHIEEVRNNKHAKPPTKDSIVPAIMDWPMQTNCAEMLRLACTFGYEDGIMLLAPVHDALLIEAALEDIEDATAQMEQHMRRASRLVLDGFELKVGAEIVRYPDRYMDIGRGKPMWDLIWKIMDAHLKGESIGPHSTLTD
ncbi:MAG TPA: DNA polymerase [Candidatus Tectomicrobia bacterium]|nr:DNA polymerase [Candidatus Tectomicrobia bacterium]